MNKQSIHTMFYNTLCAALAFLVVLALPTGWLYDLWAGTGTEQGQWPGEGVEQIRVQEDIENAFLARIPATVNGGDLAPYPLARLRDVAQEGTRYHHNGGAKRSAYVSEYITADFPLSTWEYRLQRIAAGGFYNRYYLMELGDNSWLCVYFDDYLALIGTDTYPTGYVRYTTTEERRMLKQMAEDYDVDPVYVLDMYRHGKVNWMLDVVLRLAMCVAAAVIVWGIKKSVLKCKLSNRGK